MNKPVLTDLEFITRLIRGELVEISHYAPLPHLALGYSGSPYRFKRIFGLNKRYFNNKIMQMLNLA
jgi:hypothetical protein|tara:strand:- start:175 stop:372 length:198 start_codon:yes stop_codon:yes gene_type:complete